MENNKQSDFSGKNTDSTKVDLFQNNNSNIIIIMLVLFLVLSLLGVNFLLMVGGFLDTVVNGIKYYFLQFLSFIGFYTGAIINSSADIVGDTAKGGIDIAEGTVQSIGNLLQNRDNMDGPSLEQQEWNVGLFGWNPTPKGSEGDVQSQLDAINAKLDNENTDTQKQAVKNTMDSVSPYIDSSVDKMNNLNSKIINFADEINSKGNEIKQLDDEINERKKVLNNIPSESSSSPTSVSWCPVGYDNKKGQCISIEKDEKCMYGKSFAAKEQCEENIKEPAFSGYAYQDKSINWGVPPSPPPPAALAQKPIQPCPQIPGMCMNQRPMCGSGKQLPIQMNTIPSRGQIQNGSSANAQQQQQKQLTPLPTFPQQQPQNQQSQTSPGMSNDNQSQYENPIPGSSSNNYSPATPNTPGMIINVSPSPAPVPMPMPMPTPTVSPSPAPVPMPTPTVSPSPAPVPMPTPIVSPSPAPVPMPTPIVSPGVSPAPGTSDLSGSSLDMNNRVDHHHHAHSHDGNGNIYPGANSSNNMNNIDLSGLETDINNLNSVAKNLKNIQDSNDPSNQTNLTSSEQYMKEMLQS